MKLRYVVTTFVEAESIEEALRKAKKIKPHEINLHGAWWEKRDYLLTDESKDQIGYKNNGRRKTNSI